MNVVHLAFIFQMIIKLSFPNIDQPFKEANLQQHLDHSPGLSRPLFSLHLRVSVTHKLDQQVKHDSVDNYSEKEVNDPGQNRFWLKRVLGILAEHGAIPLNKSLNKALLIVRLFFNDVVHAWEQENQAEHEDQEVCHFPEADGDGFDQHAQFGPHSQA